MESEGLGSFFKSNLLLVGLIIVAVILIGVGSIQFFSQKKPEASVFRPTPVAKEESLQIAVDIEGAVKKPGVYKLPIDGRIEDAISKAGGFSEEVDSAWVEKNVNLASKLTDGQKIYIFRNGEEITAASSTDGSGSASSLININTASSTDLDSLPGIGPVTAGKIINSRPYQTINDLLTKKIVSQSVFDKIKDKIVAN